MSNSPVVFPFVDSPPPVWASGYGQDEFGYFAEFSVSTGPRYWEFVTQRMRWIPPGTFLMGSPPDEATRFDHEGPQHEVTLSRGYWLADTACTQALWEAVTGQNPSPFQGPLFPVENVSFDDVTGFLATLNARIPGGSFSLPTEAQWEYACRAGTKTPYSFGTWLNGTQANCDGNYPYGTEDKGPYVDATTPKGDYAANAWGLYDMHGNVWEWCGDWYGDYDSAVNRDPSGPPKGSSRVIRGGSWSNDARNVRAAYRYWYSPDDRIYDLGFRLAAVPVSKPVVASVPEGEGGAQSVTEARREVADAPTGDAGAQDGAEA